MARKKAIEPGNTHHEPDAAPAAGGSKANQPSPIDEKKQRLDFMNRVQQLIRETMIRRDMEHEAKKEHIIDRLMDMGTPDDAIAYILTKKPGRDGNEYYGFTFAEMNDLRDEIGTLEMLGRKRASFAEREQERRQQSAEGQGEGLSR